MINPQTIVFRRTASNGAKQDIFDAFLAGAQKEGGNITADKKRVYRPCDIAVMLGFFPIPTDTGNQAFRKEIFDAQNAAGKKCIFVDSDLYLNIGNVKHVHFRLSYGSVYPEEAEYFNENSPSDRWELFKKRKEITVKPWRKEGNHIVLLMQRGKEGWSMTNLNRIKWANETIAELRKHTDRHIVVRPHPTANPFQPEELIDPINNISFSNSKIVPMEDDMANAWASVVFSSGSSVGSIISGVPVFVSDHRCAVWQLANKDLSQIENPNIPDREQWFNDSAYTMWNMDEMREGLYWKHLIKGLNGG